MKILDTHAQKSLTKEKLLLEFLPKYVRDTPLPLSFFSSSLLGFSFSSCFSFSLPFSRFSLSSLMTNWFLKKPLNLKTIKCFKQLLKDVQEKVFCFITIYCIPSLGLVIGCIPWRPITARYRSASKRTQLHKYFKYVWILSTNESSY